MRRLFGGRRGLWRGGDGVWYVVVVVIVYTLLMISG